MPEVKLSRLRSTSLTIRPQGKDDDNFSCFKLAGIQRLSFSAKKNKIY